MRGGGGGKSIVEETTFVVKAVEDDEVDVEESGIPLRSFKKKTSEIEIIEINARSVSNLVKGVKKEGSFCPL